ncbi:MAG: aldehyde dehydrogenase family protein [Planctomycetaceae bacterium]
MNRYGLFIDGAWREAAVTAPVTSPFTGEVVAHSGLATAADMEAAIAAADRDFRPFRGAIRGRRAKLLADMARGIEARRGDFVTRMIREAGKPRTLATVEVSRAVATFTAAAEEAKRLGGEVVPLDGEAANAGYGPAISYWFARSPVLAIAPFNFPLNLVAHKVAPALAVGAPVIVKPPPQAPGCAMLLAEIFHEARQADAAVRGAIPRGALQVVAAANDVTGRAVTDPRIGIVSFTGSQKVGWMLQGMAVGKKVVLELGGNAAVIVAADADLARAANRCAFGGFAYAGQICISVQRVLVQAAVEQEFVRRLLEEVAKIRCGDPDAADVICGPLIDAAAADRVLAWIEAAQARGGRGLAGGTKWGGTMVAPTVRAHVPRDLPLACEEVFGPVVLVDTFTDMADAVRQANDSAYGLQAGVFTDSAAARHYAVEHLEVGGIILDDIPTFRADTMPYGGVKGSGLGREGVRYAIEDFCERRTVVPRHA